MIEPPPRVADTGIRGPLRKMALSRVGRGRLLGPGHPDGYRELGHGSVLSSWKSNGRYVPLFVRCGISARTGSGRTLPIRRPHIDKITSPC